MVNYDEPFFFTFARTSDKHLGLASRHRELSRQRNIACLYNSAFAHCERERLCRSATFLLLERKSSLPFLFLQGLFAASEWEIRILFILYLPPPRFPLLPFFGLHFLRREWENRLNISEHFRIPLPRYFLLISASGFSFYSPSSERMKNLTYFERQ